jgi:hypothetical protein
MKGRNFSLIETLLIECVFFFAFFAVLRYMNIGSPRFFSIIAFLLLAGYVLVGTASYIEMLKKEESEAELI